MAISKSIGNNLPRIKVANQFSIREIIYRFGPISRLEISERLGLTLPTITTNVSSMISDGIIKEVERDSDIKALGRRTTLININEDSRYFVGIELRLDFRRAVIVNMKGKILATSSDEEHFREYDSIIDSAAKVIRALFSNSSFSLESISGLGISMPGLIDAENGILKIHPHYKWSSKEVVRDLSNKLGYRGYAYLANNAIARAYGLSLFDSSKLKNANSLAYMFVSSGIACPLLNDVRNHFGSSFGEGEVGHMVINPDGDECSCGNHGCLEAYASESSMLAKARKAIESKENTIIPDFIKEGDKLRIEHILKAEELGDSIATSIVMDAIKYLGLAIANIDNFVCPECVAIESKLFDSEENQAALMEVIHKNLYRGTFSDYRFSFIKSDEYGGARGAAAVAIKHNLELYID